MAQPKIAGFLFLIAGILFMVAAVVPLARGEDFEITSFILGVAFLVFAATRIKKKTRESSDTPPS